MELELFPNTLVRYAFVDQLEINSYTVERLTDGRLFVCKVYGGGIANVSRTIDALKNTDDVQGVPRLVEIILEYDTLQYSFLNVHAKYTCLILSAFPDDAPVDAVIDGTASFRSIVSTVASVVWQLEMRGVRDMTLSMDSVRVDFDTRRVMLYGITDASFEGDKSALCRKYAELVEQIIVKSIVEATFDMASFVMDCFDAPSMSSIVFHPYLTN